MKKNKNYKNLDNVYKFNIGNVCDSRNVEVEIKFFKHYKPEYNVNNFLFVSGEPLPQEKNRIESKVAIEVAPGGANLPQPLYNQIVEKKNDECGVINLFLDSLDWYLVSNDCEECKDVIKILESTGYEEREYDVHAGCSLCPCSPGFKLISQDQKFTNIAIFIHFKSLA